MSSRLRVRLRKSPISYTQEARGTLRALGLRRISDVSEVPDNPATRGMVRAVRFLVDVEEVPAPEKGRGHGGAHGEAAGGAAGSKAAHAKAASGPVEEAP